MSGFYRPGLRDSQRMRRFASANDARLILHYWSASDKASEITLSGNDATATRTTTNDSAWRNARSITAHNSGKWYAELLDVANGAVNGSMIFGVGNASASLSSQVGGDANSWGNQANNVGGVFVYLAGSASNYGDTAIGAGGYARLAIDFDAGKGWFGNSVTGNNGWYNSGNPSTAASPNFTFTPGTTLYLMVGMYSNPLQCTLQNNAGENAGTIPTGFSMWS